MDYQTYLQSEGWRRKRETLILNNKRARCFISGKKNNLILHHLNYRHLGYERLGIDLVILNEVYHQWLHYYLYFFWKVKLDPATLLKRLLFLKFLVCVQKGDIIGCINILCRKSMIVRHSN